MQIMFTRAKDSFRGESKKAYGYLKRWWEETKMKALKRIVLYLSVLFVAITGPALAEQLRCGTEIIEHGDTEAKVLEACGEPTSREAGTWYYNSPGELPREIDFVDGEVRFIRVGE